VTDDVALNKVAAIQRCLQRAREEFAGDPARLESQTVEDAIVLNLQRACESAIDLAMHVVAREALGVPQSSRDAFGLLERAERISPSLSARMQRMVGFRNVAVHDYAQLDRAIVVAILTERLGDFEEICRALGPG
jgi:uncharacterized protein YutE (UPF0331/DUF86 family)